MKWNKNKILIYSLLMFSYVTILCLCLVNKEKIEVAIHSEKYVQQKCDISDVVETNDCLVSENGEIEICGADPYLVIQLQEMEVGSVSLQKLKKFPGDYKIYYAFNSNFSEDKVATRMKQGKPVFIVGENVDLIRVDFERAVLGDTYGFQKDFEIRLNSYMKQIRTDVIEAVIVLGIYILVGGVYMLNLYRKKGFACAFVVWGYNIAVGYVWIQYVSRHTSMFVCTTMLVVAFLGMFFWGNHRIIEEKKCVKE